MTVHASTGWSRGTCDHPDGHHDDYAHAAAAITG